MIKFTTSWDDGDILDLRLADLLSKYGLKGTFYITQNYRANRLSEQQIKNLSTKHEIGAHTLTHPDLRNLSAQELAKEISGSKKWLEEILGITVNSFCYPKGLYNDQAKLAAKDAGFKCARTTELAYIDDPQNSPRNSDPFVMKTTLQVYPFPFRKKNQKNFYLSKLLQPFTQRAPDLQKIGVPWKSMYSWQSLARATFDQAVEKNGVFHLWGHSWEIEKYGMWEELEKFLAYVSKTQNLEAVSNYELISK